MASPRIVSSLTPVIPSDAGSPRDLPLEALRGLAALVVVVWHFLLGLAPAVLSDPGYGLAGTPLFAFVHGTAAVCVFFVLSGYVLTRRYFETGQKRILIVGALKRWCRLFLPVFLSVILSWMLFQFGFYAYEEAGLISRSQWLYTFGFAMNPPFEPDFFAALKNGFEEAFHHDNNAFNPLLWTIHIELTGSYIAFAWAAMVKGLRGNKQMTALLFVLGVLTAHFIEPFLIAFLAGPLLAFYTLKLKPIKPVTACGFLAAGIVFLGYRDPVGFYEFLDFLRPINGEPLRAYTSTIGAVLIMISFIGFEPLRRVLQGRAARYLGRMSFPIYLVHLILLFSVGSAIFVLASDHSDSGTALAITALVFVPSVLAVAALFAVIDIKWLAFVNSIFRRLKIPA